MFCPSCGTESTGLNYCNRCGANLSVPLSPADIAPINLTKPILIIGAIVLFLTLGGFLMVLSAAASLAGRSGGSDVPTAIVVCGMLTLLTLDILLIRQLSKVINAALSPQRRALEKDTNRTANTFQPPHPTTARLGTIPSVTENTTRFFENYPPAATHEPVPLPVKKTER
jgi:hypothetical protein